MTGRPRSRRAGRFGQDRGQVPHRARRAQVAEGLRDFGRSKTRKATFGAVFAEVLVDPLTLHGRVERLVGAFDRGQILEPRIARSQLVGGLVWGLGHALSEATHPDRRSGRSANASLAEALIATQADVPPKIEVITVADGPRASGAPLYLKGVSEIGVIGTAPAVANAIFDATGPGIQAAAIAGAVLRRAAGGIAHPTGPDIRLPVRPSPPREAAWCWTAVQTPTGAGIARGEVMPSGKLSLCRPAAHGRRLQSWNGLAVRAGCGRPV